MASVESVDGHPYIETLARFAAESRLADVPKDVRRSLATIVADSLAVIAAGMQRTELRALVARHVPTVAAGEAWVIGAGCRTNPQSAAMLNAIAGVWLELDEGMLLANGHPGIQSLPTALAIAQNTSRSGEDFLLAFALGYEIAGRIGAAAKLRLNVNPHGTYGVTGAAIATAKLAGFDAPQMAQVIRVAASMPMATNRRTMRTGATVRNAYAGHSGHMGQLAVQLVECGFTGTPDAPAVSFGDVLGESFDRDVAIAGLGERWMASEGYIKLYPTARYVHSGIDALYDAIERAGWIEPESIKRVIVKSYRLAAFCSEKEVGNEFGTRFSIPFAIATILVNRAHDLDAFGMKSVRNPRVQSLARRVDIVEDAAHERSYPGAQRCDLVIELHNGNRIEGHCELMRGEPRNPHQPEAIERKFRSLAEPVWGEAQARRVHTCALAVESVSDMSEFLRDVTP